MDRNLALEMIRVTEAAALVSARFTGTEKGREAHSAATTAMHKVLGAIEFKGNITLGTGNQDICDKLYNGETVGGGESPEVDLALEPLESVDSVAFNRPNALAVIAMAPIGNIMKVSTEGYMEKIAVGSDAAGVVDLNESCEENIGRVAEAKKYNVHNITVAVLKRDRHEYIIDSVKASGAKLHLIPDGDLAAAVATALPASGVDMLIGTGGASEGVIAAAALRCLQGELLAKFKIDNDFNQMGDIDVNKIYTSRDLVSGDNIMFAATGVTDGDLLNGVRYRNDGATTHSLVLRSSSRTRRFLVTEHYFNKQPSY